MNQESIRKLASKIVGDGKKPNKFFVGLSSDYSYCENGEINYIGDIFPNWEKEYSKYELKGPFSTFEQALEEAESYSIGTKHNGFNINRIWIEDRLCGEVYLRENVLDLRYGEFFENTYDSRGLATE